MATKKKTASKKKTVAKKPTMREFRAYLKTDFGTMCVRKETFIDNDKITADEVKNILVKTYGYGNRIIVKEYNKNEEK